MKHSSFKKLQEIRVFFKGFCLAFCLFFGIVCTYVWCCTYL